MKNHKILLITEHLGSGGAERQICGIAAFLTQHGYDCRLITYYDNQFYEPYLRAHNVDYQFVPDLLNPRTRVFRLIKYLYTYKPDIVISYLFSVNMTTCLARTLYKCKLIVSERNNNIRVSKKDYILFNLYRMADFVIPNSYSQADFIKRNFPFLTKKVVPIINFVDVEKFIPNKEQPINKVPRIITVARVTSQKNVLTYLEAIRIIKDQDINVHFDWFGSKSYDESYNRLVEERMRALGVDDYITRV